MRKGKVKTYVINDDGKYELLSGEQLEKENQISSEDLPKEINKILHTNPFLLTSNRNITSYIEIIEEFYITYQENEYTIESIVRDETKTKKWKKKLLIKNYRQWKKEALIILKNKNKTKREKFLTDNSERYKTIKAANIFYLLLSSALSALMFFDLLEFVSKNKVTTISFWITIIISAISLFFTILQSNKNKRYENIVNDYFEKQEKIVNKNIKAIKRNYRKLKKYYSKNYINNVFESKSYDIKNVIIDMSKLDSLEKDNKFLKDSYQKILKENKGFNIFYHLPCVMSYVLIFFNGSYVLIMLLIRLYKLIFMKGE